MEAIAAGVKPPSGFGGCVAVTTATTSMHTPIRNDPNRSDPFLPILSTRKKMKKKQATTLQTPKKPLRSIASLAAPTLLKICGETMVVSYDDRTNRRRLTVCEGRVTGKLDACHELARALRW